MKFKEADFLPLLFGNDINVYSVARAIYEEYGFKSKCFCKALKSTCYKSKMIDLELVDGLDTNEIFLKTVNEYAKKHSDKKILAVGCGDNYVKCLAANKDKFEKNVVAPYADYEFLESLMDKEKFYALCEKHGIDYPKTYICTADNKDNLEIPFDAPYIMKPANQVEYYRHHFDGQKKVFKLDTKEELEEVIAKTYAAGYKDHLIIQDFLPGDDTHMRVLTSYSDKNGKVKMMCLGHVLLEEHTPYGIGNHAVIITEYEKELTEKFKRLLDDIGYTGFSNFDIKFDSRDGKYKAFEINTRQGRSNFYVTGSGYNVAKLYADDYIYNQPIAASAAKDEHLWMVVPKKVAFDYAPEYKEKMKKLIKEHKYVNPLFFKPDNGFVRRFRLYKSQFSHFAKFKKYLGR